MRSARFIYLVGGMLLLACAERPLLGETSGETSTGAPGGGETSGAPTSGATALGSSTTGNSTTSDTTAFDTFSFVDIPPDPCDQFLQDCPEGEKCVPVAPEGGDAASTVRCVPVMGTGQPGDVCKLLGERLSGLDDCEKGAVCWDVDAQNVGFCVAQCVGVIDAPFCIDEDTDCGVWGRGVYNVCLPRCDLLLQDCPGEDSCIPIDDSSVCVLDRSGDAGAALDPCDSPRACDPGLICGEPTAATECDANATGCCVPMCDLDDANFVCPGVGQSCVPLFEPGEATPKTAQVGFCTLPDYCSRREIMRVPFLAVRVILAR